MNVVVNSPITWCLETVWLFDMVLRIFESHESSDKNMNSVSNSLRNEFRGQHANLSMNSTGNSLTVKNMNFLLPFLFPSRKCGEKSKRNSAKVLYTTKRHWGKLVNAETRKEKIMNHMVHCQETQKNTHTHYSLTKSKERPKLPVLYPILSLPPPSSSVSIYSIILRILEFFVDKRLRGLPKTLKNTKNIWTDTHT